MLSRLIIAFCAIALSVSFPALVEAEGVGTAASPGAEQLRRYIADWAAAPYGSEEEAEAAASALELLGADFSTDARAWYEAPAGSIEEGEAESRLNKLGEQLGITPEEVATGVAIVSANDASQTSFSTTQSLQAMSARDDIGAPEPVTTSPVDLELVYPRVIEAGDKVTVHGRIRNNADMPIWIVDTRARLTVPAAIWGPSSTTPLNSMHAFIPTTDPSMSDQIQRIGAKGAYTVSWLLDYSEVARASRGGSVDATKDAEELSDVGQILKRTQQTFWNYLFFEPREYEVVANIHVWTQPPKRGSDGNVSNVGDSFTMTASAVPTFTTPQTVLIFGAAIGGLICFLLRSTTSVGNQELTKRKAFELSLGIPSAILLCVIGTIMLSRLSSSDFIVSVSVNDLWGAIATGFVIQWGGIRFFSGLLANRSNESEPDEEGHARTPGQLGTPENGPLVPTDRQPALP